jgi:hypothetical protein
LPETGWLRRKWRQGAPAQRFSLGRLTGALPTLRLSRSRGLHAAVTELLRQARERGSAEETLRCLATAALGAAVADAAGGPLADPLRVGDTAIHITAYPTESLTTLCRADLGAGLRPLVIAPGDGAMVARALARYAGLGGRIDVFEAAELIATRIYIPAGLTAAGRRAALARLVKRYHRISQASPDGGGGRRIALVR